MLDKWIFYNQLLLEFNRCHNDQFASVEDSVLGKMMTSWEANLWNTDRKFMLA